MSEYQFYRFERLEGQLNRKQHIALRSISSRADITASSFIVYYHYSGLKAEPHDVMLNYFDIGFFYADWGSIQAYIKLPIGTLPEALLPRNDDSFYVHETKQWQLLTFSIEEYGEYFDDEQADDFFQHLATLRAELLQGDWRLIYFIWLNTLESDDDLEAIPMIDFDFHQLSQAQLAFTQSFETPQELIKSLALALEENSSHRPNQHRFNFDSWLKERTSLEKYQLLKALFQQGQLTSQQALMMTNKKQADTQPAYQHWLTAAVVEPYIETAHQQVKQEQAEALALKLAQEKAQKEATLTETYRQRENLWQQAQEQANRTCASGYDQASFNMHQLAEAYQLKGDDCAFALRFKQFVSENKNRQALLKRLHKLRN
ncbi:hypothetical protein [Vibrio tapetis]|uniref:Uncharacterized protein n=1 Tax=Vibrio tapetis subsp. tapetis TaxID=1671868 RepID=A0A2N8ZGI1_9VIBR|nr:hypothetical protein [Vibrio tapetis]SON50988.1 conserved protein of unknown function [Vibrio tapetis subsp. tapetis]